MGSDLGQSNSGKRSSGCRQTLKQSLTAEVRLNPFALKAALAALTSFAAAVPVTSAIIWANDQDFTVSSFLVTGCVAIAVVASMPVLARLRSELAQQMEACPLPPRKGAYRAIIEFSSAVARCACIDELATHLTAVLLESLEVNGSALYLQHPNAGTFALACTAGTINAPPVVDAQAMMHLGTAADAGACEGHHFGWGACVAVRTEESCLGFIALAPTPSRMGINDCDATFLTLLAAQVAATVQHADSARQLEQQRAQVAELHERLQAQNVSVREDVRPSASFKGIIGASAPLQRALALVEQAARSAASVLITGETGTGKELIARAIHDLSPRREGPLISVNCPVIPRQLAEAELFGHERGAFTDAVEARPGKFELADGGTIFLDEVADLPLELQVKLLRVLQERETQRIGSRKVRKLDLRIVAATNRDLPAAVRAHHFREDLYYRLAAVVVHVPPLRERRDDIPMLASCFLDRAALAYQQSVAGFSPDAMAALCRYHWPGNVRELQNVVERAVLICRGAVIKSEHLLDLAATDQDGDRHLGNTIREEKMRLIQGALAQTGGNKAAAARLLGISRSNLGRTIRSLGMKVPGRLQ